MKRLFKNTLFASADTLILIVLSLVVTPALISGLGASGYGVFVFLSIFSIYGALSFFDFGMEGALMTHVARFEAEGQNGKVRDALMIALLYYGLIGVVLAGTLYGFSGILAERFINASEIPKAHVFTAIWLVAFNVFLQFASTPFVAVLQGMHRFALTKTINSSLNIFQYLLLMGVALGMRRIDMAFGVIAALSILRLAAYAIAYAKLPQFGFRFGLDRGLFRTLLGSSSVLFVNRLIGLIYNQIGKFLIGWKLPMSQMAVYDVASRPGSLVRVVVSMIYSAIIPEVARLKQLGETSQLKDLFVRLSRYAYLAIMPMVVTLSAHASGLLNLWVGPEFAQYGHLVQLLMLAVMINPLASIASTMVVGLDAVKQTVWISVVGTIINVGVSILLIGKFGVLALILGMLAAEAFMLIPYCLMMTRILGARWREVLWPLIPILALAAMFGVIHRFFAAIDELPAAMLLASLGGLSLVHYGIQFICFLERTERQFVLSKLRRFKPTSSTVEVSS